MLHTPGPWRSGSTVIGVGAGNFQGVAPEKAVAKASSLSFAIPFTRANPWANDARLRAKLCVEIHPAH